MDAQTYGVVNIELKFWTWNSQHVLKKKIMIIIQNVAIIIFITRSCAALRAADLGLSGQDAFRAKILGRFPTSLFLPLALSSNWILILIQLLQVKDRQNVTHKQTDTVSKVAHFS